MGHLGIKLFPVPQKICTCPYLENCLMTNQIWTQVKGLVPQRIEKHCRKRRKCWLPAFSVFLTMFFQLSFSGSCIGQQIVWFRVNSLPTNRNNKLNFVILMFIQLSKPAKQLTNQPSKQPINQSINQSIIKSGPLITLKICLGCKNVAELLIKRQILCQVQIKSTCRQQNLDY